jgi:hypothetical protein
MVGVIRVHLEIYVNLLSALCPPQLHKKNKKCPVYKDFFLSFKNFDSKIHNLYLSHETVHLNLCAYCICLLEFIITSYNPLIPSSFLIHTPWFMSNNQTSFPPPPPHPTIFIPIILLSQKPTMCGWSWSYVRIPTPLLSLTPFTHIRFSFYTNLKN